MQTDLQACRKLSFQKFVVKKVIGIFEMVRSADCRDVPAASLSKFAK